MSKMHGVLIFMKGMCHVCYASGVELELVEVKSKIQTLDETVKVPICEKCRK